jgi:DNA-nicking Smr family endonuclease
MSRKIGGGRAPEPPVSQADEDLFAKAMQGVAKLEGKQRVPLAPAAPKGPKKLPPLRSGLSLAPGLGPAGSGSTHMELELGGEEFWGRALDVDRKLLKQLRQGEPAPQATLDLHGRRAAPAHDALIRFISNAAGAGKTCVLIVHGRGHHSASDGPVLKNLVIDLLSSSDMQPFVLAFASAPRSLGADGATLVRLRRAR